MLVQTVLGLGCKNVSSQNIKLKTFTIVAVNEGVGACYQKTQSERVCTVMQNNTQVSAKVGL